MYNYLEIQNPADIRMLHYYQKIIEVASSAIKNNQAVQKLLESIFNEHNPDCDTVVERFQATIDECTKLIHQINMQ